MNLEGYAETLCRIQGGRGLHVDGLEVSIRGRTHTHTLLCTTVFFGLRNNAVRTSLLHGQLALWILCELALREAVFPRLLLDEAVCVEASALQSGVFWSDSADRYTHRHNWKGELRVVPNFTDPQGLMAWRLTDVLRLVFLPMFAGAESTLPNLKIPSGIKKEIVSVVCVHIWTD